MATATKVVISFDDGSTQEVDLVAAPVAPVSVTVSVQAGAEPTATVTSATNA